MGSYFGRMGKGAARRLREQKRAEAEARNALTPPERRKSARRDCPTGKLRFASEHAAQVALVGCVIGRNRGKNQRREQRWYECPLCGGLHLTSKPDRAASRRTGRRVTRCTCALTPSCGRGLRR